MTEQIAPQEVQPERPLLDVEFLAAEIENDRNRQLKEKIGSPSKREIMWFGDVHSCDRHNYYAMAHGDERARWNEPVQAKMDAGKARELENKRILSELGYEPELANETVEIKRKGRVLARGKTDLSVRRKGQPHGAPVYPMEMKCMQPFMWEQIKTWRDLLRNVWTEKYLRQLMLYMFGKNIDQGLFLLDDFQGHWKLIAVPLDYDFIEDVLKKIEFAIDARDRGLPPERIPYDQQLCGFCAFGNICIPDIRRDPRLKVVDNKQLADALEVREANYEAWQKVERANALLKKFFEGVKEGAYTIGNFVVQRTVGRRKSLELPEDIKTKYTIEKLVYKNNIERIAERDPEEIFMGPRRIISMEDGE